MVYVYDDTAHCIGMAYSKMALADQHRSWGDWRGHCSHAWLMKVQRGRVAAITLHFTAYRTIWSGNFIHAAVIFNAVDVAAIHE